MYNHFALAYVQCRKLN